MEVGERFDEGAEWNGMRECLECKVDGATVQRLSDCERARRVVTLNSRNWMWSLDREYAEDAVSVREFGDNLVLEDNNFKV